MSLEYEINQYLEKVKKTLLIQRNIVLKDYISNYLPTINSSIYSDDEEEDSEYIVDSLYFFDSPLAKDELGSAS